MHAVERRQAVAHVRTRRRQLADDGNPDVQGHPGQPLDHLALGQPERPTVLTARQAEPPHPPATDVPGSPRETR